MNMRIRMVGAVTLGLSLACAGGEAVTDEVDTVEPAEPTPVPTPDPPGGGKTKRGRDRDGDARRPGGGGGGDERTGRRCSLTDLRASSALDGHPAEDVDDGDPKSSWCESNGGTGIGESITWDQLEDCKFEEIHLLPGNFESAATLDSFERLKRIRVYNEDNVEQEFEFDDAGRLSYEKALQAPEVLVLNEALRKSVTLSIRIDAVYPGTKTEAACISSLVLE